MNLFQLAEAGDADGVLAALAALTQAQRADLAPESTARLEAVEAAREEYDEARLTAQRLADLGCRTTPEGVADWLTAHNTRLPAHDRTVALLELHPPEWRARLVARLGEIADGRMAFWFPPAEHVIRTTGCPLPTTEGFVAAWLTDRRLPQTLPEGLLAGVPGEELLDRLRKDEFAPALLPLVVEYRAVSIGIHGFRCCREAFGLPRMEVGALICLAAEGAVDRPALIRRIFAEFTEAAPPPEDCADVLGALALTPEEHAGLSEQRTALARHCLEGIRGDWRGKGIPGRLDFLRALAPTPAEEALLVPEYVTLLRRSTPAAAEYAAEVLAAVDGAGLLPAEAFGEVAAWLSAPPAVGAGEYRAAAVATRLSAGAGIDREALVRLVFSQLTSAKEWTNAKLWPREAAQVLKALALSPAEHAAMSRERAALVESVLDGLLEDEDRQKTAEALSLLNALAPTAAENARCVAHYLALLDRASTVAGHAQQVLAGLDEAGLLEGDAFAEAGRRLLLRPEKKLVRAQLTALDKAARRDPGRAAETVAVAAEAFRHGDAALQERALDLVARHLPAAGEEVLPGLRAAAESISPALAARAAELFAAAPSATTTAFPSATTTAPTAPTAAPAEPARAEYAEVLPAIPRPRPVPAPAASLAEVVQEVAAVAAGDQSVAAFERALDGLVRHAHRDRAGLAEALRPIMRSRSRGWSDCRPADVYDVAAALRGDPPREFAFHVYQRHRPEEFSLAGTLLAARLTEAMELVETGAQPFLLAVPTDSTGALDAAVLVERTAELERLGVEAAPVDLAQALLRLTPPEDPEVAAAAEALSSEAGRRLARWLREGGLPHQDSEPADWYRPESPDAPPAPARPGVDLDPWFPPAAAALVGPTRASRSLSELPMTFWWAQLPHHHDEVTARDYTRSVYAGGRRRTRVLPFVAESGGPAGYAVHRALAEGTAMNPHGDEPTVDALLVLAARGRLDAGMLGRQLDMLLRSGRAEPNRVADSLRAAAGTGAYGTVWAVLAAALPGLLRGTPARGVAGLLALAAECVSRCGTAAQGGPGGPGGPAGPGGFPELDAVAGRKGSSLTIRNARLLRDALG